MARYPVKVPLALAVLSLFGIPGLALCYAGLCAVDFAGLLSIFGTLSTVLGVLLPVVFLVTLWGILYLLSAFLKNLSECGAKKSLGCLFRLLVAVACALSVLSPLYSVFPESVAICVAWTFAFSIELVAGVAFGLVTARFAFLTKKWLVFGVGLALSVTFLTDFGGCRVFESILDYQFGTVGFLDADSGNGLMTYLWGLSPAELDTLDGESLADIQEVSLVLGMLSAAIFGWLVSVHCAASLLLFALLAIYFVREKAVSALQNPEKTLC